MKLVKLSRGPYLFDRWEASDSKVVCALGDVPLTLVTEINHQPDARMIDAANELRAYVVAHDELILDLIYGHYCFAAEEDWLDFWKVPPGLKRHEMPDHVDGCDALVAWGSDGPSSGLLANIRWDREHKLHFSISGGRIVRINGERRWHLDSAGVLRLGAGE